MRAELPTISVDEVMDTLHVLALGEPAVRAAEKRVWRRVLLRHARRALQRVRRHLFDARALPKTSALSQSAALDMLLRANHLRALAAGELADARSLLAMRAVA